MEMAILSVFLAFVVGAPFGRSNLRQLRISDDFDNLMVEMIREYLIFYKVSMNYYDFAVVREFSALLSILVFLSLNFMKT